jgi:protein-tyrosine phosphatase
MLENGLLHILASDCHNVRNRLPGMSAAAGVIAEIVGAEYAEAMATNNPAAVVGGEAIPVRPAPVMPAKRKKWIFF